MMLLFTLLSAATSVATPQQSSIPSASTPVPKKEKKICRDDPAFTGSRISKQVCLTKEEWKRRQDALDSEGASN